MQVAAVSRETLVGVLGGDEEGSEVPESLKVWSTAFFKFVGQIIQIGDTIFEDPDPLGIKSFGTIEEVHDAPADHCIEGHQRSLVPVPHLRPLLLLVGFPEGQYDISIHPEVLFHPFRLSYSRPTLAHTAIGPQGRGQAPACSFHTYGEFTDRVHDGDEPERLCQSHSSGRPYA